VKHGLAQNLHNWPYSTFHRWVKLGVYEPRWGSSMNGLVMDFSDLAVTVNE